ncbi:MAG: hypothetical protein R3222_03480 [Balneolaceae bacterium]|nr:hypothetical protein [Balneolaceae bacterium]
MNRRKVHIILGTLMLLFMGSSLTFSTLHSHHHIQWHHSGDFTDTGNCITADISICPICGYHIKNDIPNSSAPDAELVFETILEDRADLFLPKTPLRFDEGRSPPAVV